MREPESTELAVPARRALERWRRDGTLDILAGSLVAGLAAFAYEVAGGRAFGAEAFGPVSAVLTIHLLVFSVVLLPLEQVVIRRLTIAPDRAGVPVGAFSWVSAVGLFAGGAAWLLRGRLFDGDGWYGLIVAASVATHALFATGRGHLAGRLRYRSYGISSGAATLFRLAIAGVVLAFVTDGRLFAMALVFGPLVLFAWRPFGTSVDAPVAKEGRVVDLAASDGRLMAGLVLASGASQAMLVAGPVVAAVLGATAATVSVVFATFTLFRAPISLGSNLVARLLPPFTRLAEQGDVDRLTMWSRRIAGGAIVLAGVGAAGGALFGPSLVAALFGSDFRPGAGFVAVVAAGVVLASGGLAIGQIFVARGDANRLADAWLLAVGAAALGLTLPFANVADRVATGFLLGELVALGLMVAYAGVPVSAQSGANPRPGLGYRAVKRLLDVAMATIIGVAALPVMAVVALAIVIDSGRPVLIRQTRIGRDGQPFSMWKFRTMRPQGDDDVFSQHIRRLEEAARMGAPVQPDLHIRNDPRVTRVGAVLRRWSFDEIPNLWSVIAGDMSLVGPRPLLETETRLIADILGHEAADGRSQVLPGVTGLAQVEGRDDITVAERSDYDREYVAVRSLSLDLWILFRTAVAVFRHRGA